MFSAPLAWVPYGARFTNHGGVASPIVGFGRRRTLENYRIDGRTVVDPSQPKDSETLEHLMAIEKDLLPGATATGAKVIEPCAEILVRSADTDVITDDNMGSEWRYALALE